MLRLVRTEGFILLDVALSLFIATILFNLSADYLVTLFSSIRRTNEISRTATQIALFEGLLRRMITDAETIALSENLRTHPAGTITLSNGEELDLPQKSPADPKSVAISTRRVDPLRIYANKSTVPKTLRLCPTTKQVSSSLAERYFAGLTFGGYHTIQFTLERKDASCFIGSAAPLVSLFGTPLPDDGSKLEMLAAIEFDQIIYRSTNQELRLLTVLGDEVRENQPLAQNFNLEITSIKTTDNQSIVASLTAESQRRYTINIPRQVAPHSPIEILLNIPQ